MLPKNLYFENRCPDFTPDEPVNIDYLHIKLDIMANVYVCVERQKKSQKGIFGGIYFGTYGCAYTLWYLSKKKRFSGESPKLIKTAASLIKKGVAYAAGYKSKDLASECGFLLGKAGIYALAAVIMYEVKEDEIVAECINQYVNVGSYCCSPITFTHFGGDDFFVGRTGYLCGALWLNRYFGRSVVSDNVINSICEAIFSSGNEFSLSQDRSIPLLYQYYGKSYLGAAHGLATLLLVLLRCESYLAINKNAETIIKRCIEGLIKIQTPNGNFPTVVEEIGIDPGKGELIQWCHGGPGFIYLMLKAFLKWHEPQFLESAVQIGELVWEKGLLKKGPGLCHGIAGNAYVFLALYRVTTKPVHLYRANEFAKFLSTDEFKSARVPDNPYSLFEGLCGTICFLADLMEPETSSFPFLDFC